LRGSRPNSDWNGKDRTVVESVDNRMDMYIAGVLIRTNF